MISTLLEKQPNSSNHIDLKVVFCVWSNHWCVLFLGFIAFAKNCTERLIGWLVNKAAVYREIKLHIQCLYTLASFHIKANSLQFATLFVFLYQHCYSFQSCTLQSYTYFHLYCRGCSFIRFITPNTFTACTSGPSLCACKALPLIPCDSMDLWG